MNEYRCNQTITNNSFRPSFVGLLRGFYAPWPPTRSCDKCLSGRAHEPFPATPAIPAIPVMLALQSSFGLLPNKVHESPRELDRSQESKQFSSSTGVCLPQSSTVRQRLSFLMRTTGPYTICTRVVARPALLWRVSAMPTPPSLNLKVSELAVR